MIKPIIFLNQSCCPLCERNTLDIYDKMDDKIRYPEILENNPDSLEYIVNSYELSYMKCRKCGNTFPINWFEGYPIALFDYGPYNDFINYYNSRCF